MADTLLARRESLAVVLGILLVAAGHAAHLPPWLTLLTATLLGWRLAASQGWVPLPGRGLLILLALACAASILVAYHTLFGREAGVAMLTLMVALKLMEMRTRRDAVLTVFLGWFLVLTHFLYGQDILLALYLFTATVWLLVALALLTHPAQSVPAAMRLALTLTIQALPLVVLLFVLFPRLPGPLWGLPKDTFAARSGLDEIMRPGSISRLVQSDEVVFRAEFKGPPPPAAQRYWRGPVLEIFDGASWQPHRGAAVLPAVEADGPPIAYSVTLEPHGKPWVFALELPDPLALGPHMRLASTYQLFATQPLTQRQRFDLLALPQHRLDANPDPHTLARALQLPPSGNSRARALAEQMRRTAHSDGEVVEAVLRLFREQDFRYTLTPPLLGPDGVDEFLFDTRRGFCEHYAGAFTFLMRAAGVPARVVTGYQGGEFNELGGYLIVRQSDAHAWSEVWLPQRGWVRVDPTAAVAASRIERGPSAALPAGEPLPYLLRSQPLWLKTLRLKWDALNHRWNLWVIGFDQERQVGLFARMGFGIVSWRKLAWMLLVALAASFILLAALTLRLPAPRDPVQAAWLRLCRKLARAGLPRAPQEGPLAYAERIGKTRPELAAPLAALARRYAALRYGGENDPHAAREFARQAAAFPAPRPCGKPHSTASSGTGRPTAQP
ncbi:transglutaminase TgpA family protein [Thiobacter aerophilum]|uniref:DUF3488 and transglutaminase-like domain-containing protein n=1 Tax=Thiobacter aerophilum TaxID=3121275 RepID=A0ABV0EEF2_9BURK